MDDGSDCVLAWEFTMKIIVSPGWQHDTREDAKRWLTERIKSLGDSGFIIGEVSVD